MKKNILISGVMNKTGMAIAKAFRQEGHYVYGLDKKEDYMGVCDRAFRFDLEEFVSDADYRVRFTQVFDEIIPRLSVLINNEETVFEGHLGEIQLEQWQQSINVHITGPMMLSKFFLDRLKKSRGSIININNLSSIKNMEGHVSYSTSKNSLLQLTKAMAFDLKGTIKVNSISFDPYNKNVSLDSGAIEEEDLACEIGKLSVFLAFGGLNCLSGVNIEIS